MFILIILLCLFYILKFPVITITAAKCGLILWFEKILPTLLPFAILSNIIITSDILSGVTKRLLPVIKPLLPVSEAGAFVLFSGFLFGFPMGSKNCAQLLKENKMSKEEADILFIITNNMSPVFIQNYILIQKLHISNLFIVSLMILYLPPLIIGGILLRKYNQVEFIAKKTASRSKMNFQIVDAGIMNGFETLTKIGGYIMIFSILASCILLLPIPNQVKLCCIGLTELTNGINVLSETTLSIKSKYILAMLFTSFGGLSGIAQTSAMVKDTSLSLKKYCIYKLIFALLTTLLAFGIILIYPM